MLSAAGFEVAPVPEGPVEISWAVTPRGRVALERAAATPAESVGFGLVSNNTDVPTPLTVDQMKLAQAIPAAGLISVSGELDVDDPDRLYRITIGPGQTLLRVNLWNPGPGPELLSRMVLYDGQGAPLASIDPVPGAKSLSLAWLAPRGPGRSPRSLYLGLSLKEGPAQGGDTAAWDDANQIEAPEAGMTTGGFGGTGEPSPPSENEAPDGRFILDAEQILTAPSLPVPWVDPDGRGEPHPYSPDGNPGPDRDPIERPSVPVGPRGPTPGDLTPIATPYATGPLPLMAAGPLGGALAHESPATVADSRDPVAVDRVLAELDEQGGPSSEQIVGEQPTPEADAVEPASDPALVAIRTAGGVPLFGSALVPDNAGGGATLPRLIELARHQPPAPVLPAAAPAELARDRSRDGRATLVRRFSVASAVSVALLATLGLHLPGLIDPLQAALRARRESGRSGTRPNGPPVR